MITCTHVHDMKATMETLDSIIVERQSPQTVSPLEIEIGAIGRGHVPRIRHRGSASWLNRFRKLLIR